MKSLGHFEGRFQCILGTYLYCIVKNLIYKYGADCSGSEQIFEGHADRINKIVARGKYLYSCADDGTIRKWDQGGKCLTVFWIRDSAIFNMFFHGDRIYGVSSNFLIRGWSLDGKHIADFQGHLCSITKMLFNENNIFSLSRDDEIRMWQPDGKCVKIFNIPTKISKVLLYGDYLYIGCDNGAIFAQNTKKDTGFVFGNISKRIDELIIYNGYIYEFGYGEKIFKWSLDGKYQTSFEDKNYIFCIMLYGNYLYAHSGYKICKWSLDGNYKWSIPTDIYKQTHIRIHGGNIYGGDLSSMRRWDLESGKCLWTRSAYGLYPRIYRGANMLLLHTYTSGAQIYLLEYTLDPKNAYHFCKEDKQIIKQVQDCFSPLGSDIVALILSYVWRCC